MDQKAPLVEAIKEAGGSIIEVETRREAMEDYFLRTVEEDNLARAAEQTGGAA
jgi:hypothetical protein